MLAEQVSNDDARKQWTSSRGELVIERPTPLVLVFVETGFLDAEFADHITAAMQASLDAPGKPHFFVDAELLEGYDPVVRSKATRWIARNKSRIVVQHMLVRSRLAKMGLSVASLMLGGVIQGHYERETFEQALERCIAETKNVLS